MEPTVVLQLIASEYLRGSSHQFLFDMRWSRWDGMGRDAK
jgi:hypothetical protein